MRRHGRIWHQILLSVTTLFAIAPPLLGNAMAQDRVPTRWPIEHVVVIFQENVSFDHYFGTYPQAANPPGQPAFYPRHDIPGVNGLSAGLLTSNPNLANPFRLDRSQANTCDQNHEYKEEQDAYHEGLMDQFVQAVGVGGAGCADYNLGKKLVMGYYDGNTVTALWNYAQRYAMSDNFYNTVFGPSTPGALNLIAGQTHGATPPNLSGDTIEGTVIGDPQPSFDGCSTRETVAMTGKHVGDLLNDKGVTWGWFNAGFTPTDVTPAGKIVCGKTHTGSNGKPKGDYIPHHQPFQYYKQSANPQHLPPISVGMIGKTDQANHQYDLEDFWKAVEAGRMPAVSYLKAPAYQDGHAAYSDPLAEQRFVVETINRLQKRPEWNRTAIFITYDDSDGWYDHVMPPIVLQSNTAADALTGPGSCGVAAPGAYQGRCGYGPRIPLLAISPFAKSNYVDHTVTDQSSILRFIEDNWFLGRLGNQSFDERAGSLETLFEFDEGPRNGRLILDPATGLPTDAQN